MEIFVPRSAAAVDALLEQHIGLLAAAKPTLLSISGSHKEALALAKKVTERFGLSVQIQYESSLALDVLEAQLRETVAAGITEVLLLPASDKPLYTVEEMVKCVVQSFPSLRITVSGFLRSTLGPEKHYSNDVKAVAAQVAAGAALVLTTPVWDVNHVIQFKMDLASAGARSALVEPSILPLHGLSSKGEFTRVCAQLGWTPPKGLASELSKQPDVPLNFTDEDGCT